MSLDTRTSYTEILNEAAKSLTLEPFAMLTLDRIATYSNRPVEQLRTVFPTMHDVGTAILDHERASMQAVMQRLLSSNEDPLERIILAFTLVGENLAHDVVVRAGVRIAAESRQHFPERRLDPFKTWEGFITEQLTQAEARGDLPRDFDISSTTALLVAAGMGVRDYIAFYEIWAEAPDRLNAIATHIVRRLLASPEDAGAGRSTF